MILNYIITGLVCLLLGFGGGIFTRDAMKKEIVNYIYDTKQITTVNTKSESIQQNLQYQSTIFSPNTNITISIKDTTNIIKLTNYIISNTIRLTNTTN